ncbi:Uncharacterised protein [Enterobacter cloacae]|uniref:Uncharacterized protein n=1 Tax=Enterobacter cloacae TaxID=550 RepID=A0A156Z8D5_ENTCL|nr:Uncharacterised protein [Enterobacter cloacae]SAG45279.1 Uncharacterised protein [Enterobacter cloacae]
MLRGGVGEYQGVFIRLVAEVIGNPLQLHQAADEVQARLLILHAVVPHPVAAGKFILHIDLMLTQQGFHNLRYRLALEDSQVTVALHRPQVRLHRQLVHRVAGARQLNGADRHAGNLAVNIAGGQQALRRDCYRDRLAQQLAAVDARIRAEHGQRQRERLGHRLAARQFPEQKPLHRELNGNSVEHNLYSTMDESQCQKLTHLSMQSGNAVDVIMSSCKIDFACQKKTTFPVVSLRYF